MPDGTYCKDNSFGRLLFSLGGPAGEEGGNLWHCHFEALEFVGATLETVRYYSVISMFVYPSGAKCYDYDVAIVIEGAGFSKAFIGVVQEFLTCRAGEAGVMRERTDETCVSSHFDAISVGKWGTGCEAVEALADGFRVVEGAEGIDAYVESCLLHFRADVVGETAA